MEDLVCSCLIGFIRDRRIPQDSFIEQIDFDFLEMQVIEED